MAGHRARRVRLIEVMFAGAVAGAISCESGSGRRGSSPAHLDHTTSSQLTTARTVAGEQARAAAWTDRAATYRRLSADNKAKRQAAAALADRLALAAQRTADFHMQRAAEMAALSAGGTVAK